MTVVSWLVAAALSVSEAQPVVVVSLGADAGSQQRVLAREAKEKNEGATVVPHPEAVLRLTGTEPNEVTLQELTALLGRARASDANFESERAAALFIQVVDAFEQTLRPSAQQRALTAQALHELAASLHANGESHIAVERATEAVRRFPDHPPDPKRIPPQAQSLFDRAQETLLEGPAAKLTVTSPQSGEVLVDGHSLGKSRGRVVRSLAVGKYRVWLVDEKGISLPRPVHITENSDVTVEIDSDRDRCLELSPVLALTCEDRWEWDLFALLSPLGAKRGLGVPPPDYEPENVENISSGVMVVSADKPPPIPEITEPGTAVEGPLPAFSPLYLLPFGVGQFVQDRPAFGVAYLLLDAGFIAWGIAGAAHYANVVASGNADGEPSALMHRNAALVVAATFFVGTVIEALIYGVMVGE